ncbi:MAG: endonuclease Q family protein [Candidatus Aenigmatarchaeota archaeon]
MQIIADFHIHSKYARATSKEMEIKKLSYYAKIKGLNLLGTGDFTFPEYLKELKNKLQEFEKGIYIYDNVFFMLTTEMSTNYFQNKKLRRVHHLVHVPDFDTIDQIVDALIKIGAKTTIDGRMSMNISSAELVEILTEINKENYIVPAHIWTPYFGCLGSKTGFDSIKDCYLDQTKKVYALETGLSSDPVMNWRLSSLDEFTLVSNSDSHSPWPWRLGREANVFELKKITYKEIWDAIKVKDKKRFLYTIEVNPNYGKYHYTGHRKCKIFMHPKEARKIKNICPICKKPLTIGVLQRVEDLADRDEGYVPKDTIPFKTLLPLYEIISFSFGKGQLYSKKILEEHDKLIKNFGNELNVLLNISEEELLKVSNEKIVEAIIKIRENRVNYIPGADGEYGKVIFDNNFEIKNNKNKYQKSLTQF